MAKKGGLLVANRSTNGNLQSEKVARGGAEVSAAGEDFRKNGLGDVEKSEQIGVPTPRADIHQHRARGVADIRDMRGTAGELKNQPTIDRAGGEFA